MIDEKGMHREPVIETLSPTWRFISQWATKRIDILREKNDSKAMNDVDTAYTRGRIAQLKELIGLPKAEREMNIE